MPWHKTPKHFFGVVLRDIFDELSSPLQFSVNTAIKNVLGVSGQDLYMSFKSASEARYKRLVVPIEVMPVQGDLLQTNGTTNIHPKWNPKENSYIYLSNKNNDYFGQTDLYYHDLDSNEEK